MSLRHYAALAAALSVGLMIALIGGAETASASHYRANQLNWHQDTGNTVEFHVTGSWRCTFFFASPCSASIGDTFSAGSMAFGDGTSVFPTFTVTSVDVTNDVISGEAHVDHTYPGPGPWTAAVQDCCRLSSFNGHMNNGDGSIRYETLVDLGQTSASPVSLVSPIVDCPINALCSFTVPAADPDGQGLRWRFSTSDEAAGTGAAFNQPAGATINATTGLYQWDTTGAPLAPAGSTFYSTQIMVENLVGGVVVSKTAVDFFIRLGSNSTNAQPVFVAPTPADGSVIDGTVGSLMTFDVAATDPDTGDVVTLAMLGQPAGSSFSPTSGNPATGTFSWTPTAAGDYLITLTAADQLGLGAVPRGIILRIALPTATTSVSGDGRFNSGAGRVDFELSDDTVLLVQSRGAKKFTFNGDVDSIVGAGNSATMTGTGTYNGVAGYTFSISVVDNGTPGSLVDTIDVVIRDAAGVVVFSTGRPELLKPGNIIVTNRTPN
jgi:Putative Ig domain